MKIPKPYLIFSVAGSTIGGVLMFKVWTGGVRYDHDYEHKLYGKTAIVTGANTGIGKETAKELARRGARVILACRDLEKCEKTKAEIYKYSFNKNVHCRKLDLASIASIRAFAKITKDEEKHINILVNNAGVMSCPKNLTTDGFEWQFGVNHLGHFLLTNLLLDKIKQSGSARIITLTSPQYKKSEINFKDLNCSKDYNARHAYGQSKLANVLFAVELARRLEGTNVCSNLVYPGVCKTEIARHTPVAKSIVSGTIMAPFIWIFYKVPWQGAQTSIYACVEPELEGLTGKYFHNLKEEEIAPLGLDEEAAKRLWAVSARWTRLS